MSRLRYVALLAGIVGTGVAVDVALSHHSTGSRIVTVVGSAVFFILSWIAWADQSL